MELQQRIQQYQVQVAELEHQLGEARMEREHLRQWQVEAVELLQIAEWGHHGFCTFCGKQLHAANCEYVALTKQVKGE